LPAHDEASPWARALLLFGTFLVITRAQFEAGWSARDFSAEPIKQNWLKANCANPGELTAKEMADLHARKRAANIELLSEVEPKEEYFNAHRIELMAPWWSLLTAHILTAVK